ncbi:MAG: PepSY domain-containing protein [Clostridia bacterium]|nr:PepSY domain-containing protein [Clostridia bacterium]
MKKKLAFILAGVIAVSSFAVGAMSKSIVEKIEAELRGDFTVYVDGKKQTFRDVNGKVVDPILYEGTTYLPVRAIGELMGKTVYWYQDEKKIELVEPSGEKTLVTDADVIVDGADKVKEEKIKEEKPGKAEKPEKEKATEAEITLDEAKEIVLEKAELNIEDVVFTKTKLEFDDGRWVYEIDFKTDEARYDTEVDATDGEILQWEVEAKKNSEKQAQPTDKEVISLEKAKSIALKKAGLKEKDVVFEEAKLDYDNGRKVYDIEFRQDRVEYSAEIDAVSGEILEWEKDVD